MAPAVLPDISCRGKGQGSERRVRGSLKTETAAQASYGSAEHHKKFAESLGDTGASGTQIGGRLAAARSEVTHPSPPLAAGKATRARKSRPGAKRGKGGVSR
ncbi:hypothetical protein ARTHRO9V_40006 [Arthrobacter sp. 9V]|nr:hypothetical protein ARTHRO9V_40006 [Arthrobacter sp. 9V]